MCQSGGNALAHGVDGREHFNNAFGLHTHGDAFFQCIAARPLQKGGQAQAAQLAARLGLCRASLKACPIGQRQALVHHRLELARVIGLAHGVFVGHLVRLDEIAAAQGHAVHADLAGGFVHEPFHDEDGFRPPRTPVGAGGRGVGHHGFVVEINRLDVIHAGLHPGANQDLDSHACTGGISAHVAQRGHPQRQNFAAGIQSQSRISLHVSPVVAGQKFFTALGGPLHGALDGTGAIGHHHIFGVSAGLHAKAAAHVAHHHAHGGFFQAQAGADRIPHARRHLSAHADGEATRVCIHRAQHRAWLQRESRHALVDDIEFDNVLCAGKCSVYRRSAAVAGFGRNVIGGGIT